MAATSAIEKLLGEMFTMMDEDGDGKIDKAECVKVFCDTDTVIVRRALDCLCDFKTRSPPCSAAIPAIPATAPTKQSHIQPVTVHFLRNIRTL